MSPETITWIWIIGGLLLIVTELFTPGFVAGFFGIAAMLVGALRWIGLLSSFIECLVAWFGISVVLLLTLRHFAIKWSHPETEIGSTDEDLDATGEIAEVVSTMNETNQGRIRFRGTTWLALSTQGTILPGSRVRILYRDNLIWKVEAVSESGEALQTHRDDSKLKEG
jgi:hypothetical protein